MPGLASKPVADRPLAIVESESESVSECVPEPVDEAKARVESFRESTRTSEGDDDDYDDDDLMLPLPANGMMGGAVSINGSPEDESTFLPLKIRFGSFREAGSFSLSFKSGVGNK